LPADATPEGVPLTLVDTSSREEDRAATDAALRAADVVVLAFDAGEFRERGGERGREERKEACAMVFFFRLPNPDPDNKQKNSF
jgi:hypothetical protein